MFDIGFTEMLFVAIVALIVIGPEKLPKVAKTVGHLFGRMQSFVANVKYEINREAEIQELHQLQEDMQSAAKSFEKEVTDATAQARSSLHVDPDLNDPNDTAPKDQTKVAHNKQGDHVDKTD